MRKLILVISFLLYAAPAVAQETLTASDGTVYQVKEVTPPEPVYIVRGESKKIGLNCEIIRISLMKQVKICTWTGEVTVSDDGVITEISGGKSSEEEWVMIRVFSLIIIVLITGAVLLILMNATSYAVAVTFVTTLLSIVVFTTTLATGFIDLVGASTTATAIAAIATAIAVCLVVLFAAISDTDFFRKRKEMLYIHSVICISMMGLVFFLV